MIKPNKITKPNANSVGAGLVPARNSRGITLVALIITIIIMLILVGVTVSIVINGGLFETAKQAVKQTEIEAYKEKIEAIRINLLPEQITEGLEGKEYIDRFEEEIRKDSNFKESTITRKNELTLTVITKEGYEFEITEEETKYIGKGEVEKPEETKPEDLNKSNTEFTYTPEGWTSGPVKVKIEVTGEIKGTLEYSIDGQKSWTKYKTEEEIEINDNIAIYARVINNQGKAGTVIAGNVTNIDKNAPDISKALQLTGVTASSVDLSIEVKDELSGISKIEWYYKVNGASTYEKITEEYTEMNGENVGKKKVEIEKRTLAKLTEAETYKIYAKIYDVAGNSKISNEIDTSYENAQKDEGTGVLKVNARYTDAGKIAIVPKGFKIVEGIEGTKKVDNGLVIQDKDGNEFVWIPVLVTESDKETEIASFYRSEWTEDNKRGANLTESTEYIEPYENGYTGEVEEYAEMVKSVYKNHGFYIGRYEAGSKTERTNKANGTTEMLIKKDQFVYNYVGWGASTTDYTIDVVHNGNNQGKGMVYLSKQMYEGKDVGVTSTLCYGVQWDTMLDFIKDEKNVTNSSSWGNYAGNGGLKNTGSSDIYLSKNIYDIAGNLYELTMEASYSPARTNRGGAGDRDGLGHSASVRSACPATFCGEFVGFRVALYVK